MQNMANTTTGFTPPGVGGAANGGAPTTRTGKPGRPRGSTKNGNASTTAALKSAAKGAVQKQNSKRGSMKTNDGLEALAMATAASDAKNSKKGADATNNKRAAPGATTSGKMKQVQRKRTIAATRRVKLAKIKIPGLRKITPRSS